MSDEQIIMACKGKSKSQGGLNVGDVKQILKDMGLPITGTRQNLLDRLCPLTKDKRKSPKAGAGAGAGVEEDAGASKSKTGIDEFMYDRSGEPSIIKIGDIKLDMSTFSTSLMRDYILHSVDMKEKRQIIELGDDFIYHMRKSVESSKFETGGMIDIDNDGVFERATFRIGNSGSVNIKELKDYEIYYHIHPPRPILFDAPSAPDILSTYFSRSQVNFIFAIDAIYSIYMDKPKFEKFMENVYERGEVKTPVQLQQLVLDSIYEHVNDPKRDLLVSSTAYLNYLTKLNDLGVYIIRQTGIKQNTWPKKVIAFIKPYEIYRYTVPNKARTN